MRKPIGTVCLALSAMLGSGACSNRNPVQPALDAKAADGGLAAGGVPVTAPKNSEQLVFSGLASMDSTFQNGSSVAFWIWCEPESTNPYAGECNGALRFDALGITKHVEDASVAEIGDDLYRVTVKSTLDDSVECTLSNTSATVNGPHNTVRVDCQAPAGSAVSNNAVVNVTGPGD